MFVVFEIMGFGESSVDVLFHSHHRWIKETMTRTSMQRFSGEGLEIGAQRRYLFGMCVNALPMRSKVLRNSGQFTTMRN